MKECFNCHQGIIDFENEQEVLLCCACVIANALPHVTATLALRFPNRVPFINQYVRYSDLSRAIMAHSSPRLPEAFDFGASGAGFLGVVVEVENLWLIDFVVGGYILVMFDPVVLLTFSIELFWVVFNFSDVKMVLVDCNVFGVTDIAVLVVVWFLWCFVSEVGAGVHVSPGTVEWKQLILKKLG